MTAAATYKLLQPCCSPLPAAAVCAEHPQLLTEPQLAVLLQLPTFPYANTLYLIVYAVLCSWNDSCSYLRAVAALRHPLPGVPAAATPQAVYRAPAACSVAAAHISLC